MDFYLGTHQPGWLASVGVPLFVSHRRLSGYVRLPRARGSWALDSGGFSELSMFGERRSDPGEYVCFVDRYDREIGNLNWAAPQDWMCQPWIVAKTGRSVREHQERTVENFVELLWRWDGMQAQYLRPIDRHSCPFMPVLQGWTLADYFLRTIAWSRSTRSSHVTAQADRRSARSRQARGRTRQLSAPLERISRDASTTIARVRRRRRGSTRRRRWSSVVRGHGRVGGAALAERRALPCPDFQSASLEGDRVCVGLVSKCGPCRRGGGGVVRLFNRGAGWILMIGVEIAC